jgi:two-component system cell cycle response regulator
MERAIKLKDLAKDMSVLYVEDEKLLREEMAEFLKKFFLSVDTAKNGKEGLDLFAKHRQDIVITDIVMPVMEGEDMMAQIRDIEHNVPILIVSAYEFSDFLIPKFPNGANAFVRKPATYEVLVTALCELIEKTKHKDDSLTRIYKVIQKLEKKVSALEDEMV